MKTVADPQVLHALVARLNAVTPASTRRWGTLTAAEMLCHLGDATDMVLGVRPRETPMPPRRRPFFKLFILWLPFPWPHGVKTNPQHDPKAGGTRPTDFERDRARAVRGLADIAAAGARALEPVHGLFGTMTPADWQRWAWRHTDHHLRQFGL